MKIGTRETKGVTILDIQGKFCIDEGTTEVRDRIRELLEGGNNKILVNLERVKYVDSTGIGTLVASFTSVARDGGQLKLAKLGHRLQRLLSTTKLLTVFDAYGDEAEAISSFQDVRS